ncbi:hypothetical protein [Granulosicoccus antarcticus]|uniref:Uncharacterized protein n=1 Tax=Granulosicoccus antarcticus IMCC3135 TaxID=1192854 RepID=A0A2Z2NYW3_9GAMM|nr:hypothetical protein [Granulosicoccus antarcticus]ASJ76636.1 hypothetical protein IMCC3135_32960 [Granulosicoccus antarcticus IMCC3135]
MCKKIFLKIPLSLLLSGLFLLCVATPSLAQQDVDHKKIVPTGQWVDSRKSFFNWQPIFLHLRTGHERALMMPEPVRLSNEEHKSAGYELDISEDVVRFYPKNHFDRESIRLTGLNTGTQFLLRVRSSAYGIRQPLQVFQGEFK